MLNIFLMVVSMMHLFIQKAREVIHKGAIWRIGNGEAINIWDHHWLPGPSCSKIVSLRASSNVVRVCDLFFPNSRTWDPSKLASCF